MEFFGQKGSWIYTITVEDSKVESVLVENAYSAVKKRYMRPELSLDKELFKKAVNIFCKDDSKHWELIYEAVKTDFEYAQVVLEEYEKFITPFLNTTIHQDLLKKQE